MKTKKVVLMLVATYCPAMLFILFGRSQIDIGITYWEQVMMNINLRPFSSISQYAYILIHKTNTYLLPYAAINIFGNIVAFVPYGFFFPRFFRRCRSFPIFFIFSICILVLIESIQLFSLRGCFDVDDVILNLIGGILGYIVYKNFDNTV